MRFSTFFLSKKRTKVFRYFSILHKACILQIATFFLSEMLTICLILILDWSLKLKIQLIS